MRMNNIARYTNESPDAVPLAVYYKDNEGRDWYENVGKFDKGFSVGFDSEGVVTLVCKSVDLKAINPEGMSIVDMDELPEGISIDGTWISEKNSFKQSKEAVAADNGKKRARLISSTTAEISLLEDMVLMGDISTAESDRLDSLKKYRIKLYRLDVNNPDWPTI